MQQLITFTIGVFLVFTSCSNGIDNTSKDESKHKFPLSTEYIDSYVGAYNIVGADLNFDSESFKGRHAYEGTMYLSKVGNTLKLKMVFATPVSPVPRLANTDFAMYSDLAVNGQYLVGDYALGTDALKGFGSINIKMNEDGSTGRGYTVFSSEYLSTSEWGMTKFELTRK